MNWVVTPVDDINAATVASALESQLGGSVYVDCNPAASGWLCTEHQLSETRQECQVGAANNSPPVVVAVVTASAAETGHCKETSSSTVLVSQSAGRLVETELSSGASARRENTDVMSTDTPRHSPIYQLLVALRLIRA